MVKLPEIILGTAMLEKMLSINVLELVLTLLGCRIQGERNEMKGSLGTQWEDEYYSATS